jgi:hypothetical protein
MTDVSGWRRKFGVIGPSTSTVVQPDFDDMRPAGVTHYSRIFTPNADAVSNDTFRAATDVKHSATRPKIAAGADRAYNADLKRNSWMDWRWPGPMGSMG